jgi:tRNA pseudouridine55 synthase
MPGFLLIDKPVGWTSFDVVAKLRRITGEKRIGHAGTLDPFATGLLVVGVGREATRELGKLMGHEKEYAATARLGATSDTQDLTGTIVETPVYAEIAAGRANVPIPTREQIEAALENFRGEISQIPPMYSAKKIGGQKLYDLARAGQIVEREPRRVTIREFELLDYAWPELKFRVTCSAGTYVRTLAHDLGQALGCGAYLTELRRARSGDFRVEDAQKIENLTPGNWRDRLIPV